MKASKQSSKSEKISKQMVPNMLPAKKKAVKVVDVRLGKEKSSKTKDSKGRSSSAVRATKNTESKGRSTAVNRSAKKSTVTSATALRSEKPKASPKSANKTSAQKTNGHKPATNTQVASTPKMEAKAKPLVRKAPEVAKPETAPVLETPFIAPDALSLELLRPFREAAKRNKKLQKERERNKSKSASFLAKPLKKGKKYIVDLRVHSPGSRGFFSTGGVDPAPALIRLAKVKGLDMVGLTDCNDASYLDSVKACAEKSGITIIPGLELLCSVADCDEISILALFPETHSTKDLNEVLNELGVPKWAHGRPDFCIPKPFAEIIEIIERRAGLIIPSRIDKTPFRHLAIPTMVEKFGFHAFDLIHPDNPDFFKDRWPKGQFTFFSFSNANALGQIGSRTSNLRLEHGGFAGIKELVKRRPLTNLQ